MTRIPVYLVFLWCAMALGSLAQEPPREARIGVLAFRGSDQVQDKWQNLSTYLNATIPEWTFSIIPMTLSSAFEQIETEQLDFVVTNPGHFVDLNGIHRMSVIASRLQRKSDGSLTGKFGSTIFALKRSGISTLQDVKGKTVAAVDRYAFGGFQLAWSEFDRAGIDLHTDPAALRFVGFPMDQIVRLVQEGGVDVGIVRSGLIEELAAEGRVDPAELEFLNSSATYGHPDITSTRLVPEWTFSALATTDPVLRDRVALTLLQSGSSPAAQKAGMIDNWSAPVSYHSVVELRRRFDSSLAVNAQRENGLTRLKFWIVFAALPIVLLAGWVLWLFHSKRKEAGRSGPVNAGGVSLTQREEQVLKFVAQGHSTKEIAKELGISPKTVEFHRANLLKKFGARTSSQLVAMAT
ncbi:PhnD/SsuA/transferrin family substrate-binding protein [Neptunicoccus cionae]|uniref:HTH luxR-type domain-containing protein n=1 Tax=Neptunicoccus cionae TaxID=2035344 RepID=A0A916R0S3_9RHOB|nr:PhnD/SsuA/transferrin family substrate-binding protein [Amylibacter cionae]GGA25497.1 hypothetical protein GCM10011498_28010 [Amylibacter cionae]